MKTKIVRLEEKWKPWTKSAQTMIRGILVSDKGLEKLEEMEPCVSVPVYGGVDVDQEINDTLARLGPKFTVCPNLDLEVVETNIEKAMVKARWEDRNKEEKGAKSRQ